MRLPLKSSGNLDKAFLFLEFDGNFKEEFSTNGKATVTYAPKKSENKEDGAMQQEITKLRNLVWSLQEKERGLELQLLEYYGMQEQEAAVRELENQIKINSVQDKLNTLRIESLLADNQKIRDQLIDYSRTVNELEAAKGTIKLLNRKLKLDSDQAEKVTSLNRRIVFSLQSEEHQETRDDEEISRRVNKMEELEFEIANLNCMNSRLSEENWDLTRKMELVQASASGDQKVVCCCCCTKGFLNVKFPFPLCTISSNSQVFSFGVAFLCSTGWFLDAYIIKIHTKSSADFNIYCRLSQ